jgi:hypothetical protein
VSLPLINAADAISVSNRRPRCFLETTRLNTIVPSFLQLNRSLRSSLPGADAYALLGRPSPNEPTTSDGALDHRFLLVSHAWSR